MRDAACGPGLSAADLVDRGARVIGADISPRMVELARHRAPGGEFRVHDLAQPLDWLPDALVDRVLLALAVHYLDDRIAALRELGDWLRHGGNYFEPRVIEEVWSRG